MGRPKPEFTWDELDAISVPAIPDAQPPGTFNVSEYAERYGIATNTATQRLNKLCTQGALEARPLP